MRTPGALHYCGNSLVSCPVPALACAPGWHVCMSNGWPQDLTTRLSRAQCASAGPGVFLAGSTLRDDGATPLACDDSCGTEDCQRTACCGTDCAVYPGPGGVWGGRAPYFSVGCSSTPSANGLGVLCCRDPAIGGP